MDTDLKTRMSPSLALLTLLNLTPNTTYYYRAVVSTSNGNLSGDIKSFTTPNYINCRYVTTGDATDITTNTAKIVDNFYSTSFFTGKAAEEGVQLRKDQTLTGAPFYKADSTYVKTGDTTNTYFSVNITGLQPNTTYYYRAYVLNSATGNYHLGLETKSFTTGPNGCVTTPTPNATPSPVPTPSCGCPIIPGMY